MNMIKDRFTNSIHFPLERRKKEKILIDLATKAWNLYCRNNNLSGRVPDPYFCQVSPKSVILYDGFGPIAKYSLEDYVIMKVYPLKF